MRHSVVVPPTIEPVTLDEAKAHLRVTHAKEDDLILLYLRGARLLCEVASRRSFIEQTHEVTFALPRFQGDVFNVLTEVYDPDDIRAGARLVRPPVKEIVSVKFYGSGVATVTSQPDRYLLQPVSNVVLWSPWLVDWLRTNYFETVVIRYTAGQSYDNFRIENSDAILAILVTLTFMYEHRGYQTQIIPAAAMQLLGRLWSSPTLAQ